MKLIIAIVRPEKLRDVKDALFKEKVHMMTIIDVRGCGQQKGFIEEYRGVIEEVELHRKVMLLIAVNESYVEKTVKAIMAEPLRAADLLVRQENEWNVKDDKEKEAEKA